MDTIRYLKTEIELVANELKKGKVIAFPTDTVYGLGVVYDDEAALQRLKIAKGRPETKPIPTMAASSAQIEEVAIVDERSKKLIDAFMPGAFTLILPKQPSAPAYVSNGMDTIAVRIPDDPFVLELLKQVGKPMLVTSANLSDQPAATTGIEALGQLDGGIDGIVMGASGVSAASTILDVTKTEWQILRCGAVSEEQIEAVIGEKRKMRIALACDHGALEYKEILKKELPQEGYEVVDFGTYSHESCDYPDYIAKAAQAVAKGECDRGIVLCGTGIGASIAANKIKGIRCALCSESFSARLTREHNDSNILAMGQRVIGEEVMRDIVKTWLTTPFSQGERHKKRIAKLARLEQAD